MISLVHVGGTLQLFFDHDSIFLVSGTLGNFFLDNIMREARIVIPGNRDVSTWNKMYVAKGFEDMKDLGEVRLGSSVITYQGTGGCSLALVLLRPTVSSEFLPESGFPAITASAKTWCKSLSEVKLVPALMSN